MLSRIFLTNSFVCPRRRHVTCAKEVAPIDISNVPREIWEQIIREATLTYPDPLDENQQELSFIEQSSVCDYYSEYLDTLRTKINFSLVSREWYALTCRFVLEFVWISRASQAKSLAKRFLMEHMDGVDEQHRSGRFLRRLHIQTAWLDRCAPPDLRTILDYSPLLTIYSDHHSIQQNLQDQTPDPRCTPEQILTLLAHPKIRRLSWTSYDNAPFHLRMSPFLRNLTTRLEYLELSSHSPNFRAVFSESLTTPASPMQVTLPALRSLKVSLDNATFAVLASWDMPLLTNLSVVSADFSYTGPGFSKFFELHGAKIVQLELGHSSSAIEEHYLTTPHGPQRSIPLADWCPNLRELICSADAEWHWESPDWIAPHILLPSHPKLELIGIRDIDTRLLNDPDIPDCITYDTPFFPLYEQICSLLQRDAFPNLRYVRDLSHCSHHLRTRDPSERVLGFWVKLISRCREREVWFEDCNGVNITLRGLHRASLSLRGSIVR
jgi:hypothetical protein